MQKALDALQAGAHADALLAAEYACRRFPSNGIPAVLRARILQECRPGLAPKAWYRAWCCDPLNPQLQDAMLQAWLASGAAASVLELGPAFLPARCRAGTHAPLVNLLRAAGQLVVGACWKNRQTIEAMVFAPAGTAGQAPRVRLLLSDETTEYRYDVPADGTRFTVPLPKADGVWSLALAAPEGKTPPLLHGSPLALAPQGTVPPGLSPAFAVKGTVPAGDRPPILSEPKATPTKNPGTAPQGQSPSVSIVIPVYRGHALVQSCIESVLATLAQNKTPAHIVVVDDCSPEPALSAWLATLAADNRITLLRNHRNLGFIEAVNRGLRQQPTHDALLLNADTQVHGDWIDRLCAALYSAPDIASVTPWTNNGEISSFPRIAAPAPAPSARQLAEVDTIAAMLHKSGATIDVELPSCCGFTLLMRRDALDSVGLLDGANLVRGYCEEVDWCLRAREQGMRHLQATGVFVAHVGTVSFRFEKTLRVRQNRAVIAARYPDFYPEYEEALADDLLAAPRKALEDALDAHSNAWLPAARMALDGVAEFSRPLPEPLPQHGDCPQRGPSPDLLAAKRQKIGGQSPAGTVPLLRIAVWQHRHSMPGAHKVLALARLIAGRPAHLPRMRLLVIGEANEALWRTGVVDVLPFSTTVYENTLLSDAMMVGLTGCTALLSDGDSAVPLDIAHTIINDAFQPSAWLAAFDAKVAAPPPTKKQQPKQKVLA